MKTVIQNLPFPKNGLNTANAFDDQPPLTTPQAVNVRGYSPSLGRAVLCQRPGMSRFMAQQLNGGAYAIQCLDILVATTPSADGIAGGFLMVSGGASGFGFRFSYFTQAGGGGDLTQATSYTGTAEAFGAVIDPTTEDASAIYIVLGQNIVCYNGRAQFTSLKGGVTTNLPGTFAWTTASPDVISTPCGMDVANGKVWLATTAKKLYSLDPVTGAISAALYTSARAIAALADNWLMVDQGVACLGFASGYVAFFNTVANTLIQERRDQTYDVIDICKDGAGHFFVLSSDDSAHSYLYMYDILGNIVSTTPLLGVGRGASCCYDPIGGNVVVVLDASVGGKDVYLYSGAQPSPPPTPLVLLGSGLSSLTAHFTGVRSLSRGDFLGTNVNTTTGAATYCRFTFPFTPPATYTYTELDATASITGHGAAAMRYWPTDPGGANLTPSPTSFYVRGLGVSGGVLQEFTPTGPITIPVSDSNGNMSPGVPRIFSSQIQNKMYFCDGIVIKVYNPTTASVAELVASVGTIPGDNRNTAPRLMCGWRDRLVIAGWRFDPFNWAMSAAGDPTNWAFNPFPALETGAVIGNNSAAGLNPDVLTCIFAYSDEILMMGGSRSIYQMTGDPLSGGRIDLVTNEIGMAFGRPFCRDGSGVIYFMSNRGSIYRFAPGGLPEQISDPINQLVLGIDFDKNIVCSAWDERSYGAHFWISPVAAGPALHYFFDAHSGAFWQDQYQNTHNPFAAVSWEDGDPNQRFILIGCNDGVIRKLDINAKDDDGIAIQSSCAFGPIKDKDGQKLYISDLQCDLDLTSDAVTWKILSSRDAQSALSAGQVLGSGTFFAGRSRSQAVRAAGHAHYITLGSLGVPSSSFALEYLRCRLAVPQGKAPQRIWT